MKRIVLATTLTLLAAASVGADRAPPVAWTVLVYMNANNNLESDAIDNYDQMKSIGSSEKVKVIVEFARLGKDARYQAWNSTYRFEVQKDKDPIRANAIEDIGRKDMGSGRTLQDFVSWGRSRYPATHIMLVVWDHGQGWRLMNLLSNTLKTQNHAALQASRLAAIGNLPTPARAGGVAHPAAVLIQPGQSIANPVKSSSCDDASKHCIYNRELADSVRAGMGGQKLDVLAFDACLMAMAESAYAFQGVAKYLVASEELEPGEGWDYGIFLSRLKASASSAGAEVAKMTVRAYAEAYSKKTDPTTMSAIDLSRANAVAIGLAELSANLLGVLPRNFSAVHSARKACGVYGASYGYTSVDIHCFLDEVGKTTSDPSSLAIVATARAAVESAVLDSYASENRKSGFESKGLAIYFPADGTEFLGDGDADAYTKSKAMAPNAVYPVAFVQDGGWVDFLADYFKHVPR